MTPKTERAVISAYTGGVPVKEIFERFLLNAKTLYALLEEAKVKLRQDTITERNAVIRRERKAGAEVCDLAAKHGLSTIRIRQIVRTGR